MWAHYPSIASLLPSGWTQVINDYTHTVGGRLGVNLFFVLSGFLVSGLLFDEHDARGTIHLKRFLIRRAFKIVPAFYFLVLVTVMVDATYPDGIRFASLFHDIFFLQSYREGLWPHAWTLAVEVHFYLLLALLLSFLAKTSPVPGQWLSRLPGIIIGVLMTVFLLRLLTLEFISSFHAHNQRLRSHLNLDVLAAGVLLRYIYTYHFEYLTIFSRGKALWGMLGLLVIFISSIFSESIPPFQVALAPSLFYLGAGLILIQVANASFPQTGIFHWLFMPFDFLGKHSYSIYLWHLPFRMWIVDSLSKKPGFGYLFIYFVGSLALGSLLSNLLEMPVLHLRNRLFPSFARRLSESNSVEGDTCGAEAQLGAITDK
jgi:peptidoglycan/LPS O-acetylase OafA/YrhL